MRMRWASTRLTLALLATVALAACALGPTRSPTPAVVIARPEPPPTTITPITAATARGEPWKSLVASFVMQDCANAPLIHANAAMYTRSPKHFEQLLRQSLPMIMYVQQQLHDAGIPGEFAMLPMLESSYHAFTPRRRGGAAGMWQMMPRTARLHGLVTIRGYDGRLDPVASTRAAIHMLQALDERFDDWRLVDMAYNAGPYAVMEALRHNPDATNSPIPDLPLSNTTLTHLARLMALSCILRQPARFEVKLPEPATGDRLVATEVPAGTRLKDAAQMAELSESTLRDLNPGYTGASVPAASPRTLLLPVERAESLAAALAVENSESVAQVDTRDLPVHHDGSPPLPAATTPPDDAANGDTNVEQHRVRKGETLWSIAQRYHVSVDDLKQWNGLHGDALRPGEMLDIQG